MIRDSGCKRRWLHVMVLLPAFSLAVAGCSRLASLVEPRAPIVFPNYDTADQQFFYAVEYDRTTLVPRGTSGKERLQRIIAGYQTVIDHFPNDQTYVPLSYAAIGNCYFRMEEYRRTIRIYQGAMERYPNYPFLHAEGAWKIGRSYELLGRPAEAKRYYKSCVDTFRHSKSDRILAFVALCRQQWKEPSVPGEVGRRSPPARTQP